MSIKLLNPLNFFDVINVILQDNILLTGLT